MTIVIHPDESRQTAADGDLFEAISGLEPVHTTDTANAGNYTYSYVNINGVLTHVRPILAGHNIIVQQSLGGTVEAVAVKTILRHRNGWFWESDTTWYPRGRDAQVHGSVVTYLRRYSLLAFLGLPTEDDDGARSARASAQSQARSQAQRQTPSQRPPAAPQQTPPPPAAPTLPPARTHEEAAMRAMPSEAGLSEVDTTAFWHRFVDQFGMRLRELPPERHEEAHGWCEDEIEFFRAAAQGGYPSE